VHVVVAAVVVRVADQAAGSKHGVAGQLRQRLDMRAVDVVAVAGGRARAAAQQRKGSAGNARSRRRHCARRIARLWHV